ncbi:MAG: RIP metalloprotease RseP [Candidatus Omnitrophica bacterium]|nr:RIP metalloprotease RseP [Candidatus Omnitrophota bacterium]
MMPWLAFLVTLSLIILVHEWGHFVVARAIGVKVERFSFGFGPRLAGWVRGGTEYWLSLLPFGGYVKLAGEAQESGRPAQTWEYRGRSILERIAIVAAGPAINYLLGFLLFFVVFQIGAPVFTTQVGQVMAGYPAADGGILPGDRILAVNGVPVKNWEEMTRAIQRQTHTVSLTVEREGKAFPKTLRPKVTERAGLFGRARTAMVGIMPSDNAQVQRYPAGEAFRKAGTQVAFLTRVTLESLWGIATRRISLKESVTGPIGIFHITASVAEQGVTPLLWLIATLSTSIGLFNLLPVPVLDGGHLAFLVAERLRGRPVSMRAQEAMTRVGLGLLLLLLAVVTYNDFLRFDVGGRLRGLFGAN